MTHSGLIVDETQIAVVEVDDNSIILQVQENSIIVETSETGPQGPTGLQGIQGIQGEVGPESTVPGPQGDKGDKGDKGDTGSPGGTVAEANWRFQTGTGAPSTGYARYDSGIFSLFVSQIDDSGFDRGPELAAMSNGDQIVVRDTNGAAWFLSITATPTDDGAYWTFIVNPLSGPQPPKNNQILALSFIQISSIGDAGTLDGHDSSYFVDVSAGYQIKTGDLSINTGIMNAVDLNEANISAGFQLLNVTTAVLLDSFPYAAYRSAEYTIQLTQGTSHAMTRIMFIHDAIDVAISEYGHVEIGTPINYDFQTNFSLGNLEVLIQCPQANITPVSIKFSRVLFDV